MKTKQNKQYQKHRFVKPKFITNQRHEQSAIYSKIEKEMKCVYC